MKKVLFLLLALLIVVSETSAKASSHKATHHSYDNQRDPEYIAVIDAGSSGSRIFLYQLMRQHGQLRLKDLFSNEPATSGISSFVNHPEQAGSSGVQPLLLALQDFLAKNKIETAAVEVNVLGTAGMRMVASPAAQKIYDSISSQIVSSGFKLGRVETITGVSEGLYSWIDVNELLGTFKSKAQTRAMIEIGGASAQIAYGISKPSGDDSVSVSINGKTYHVFSESFLGLGRNQSRKLMIDHAPADEAQDHNPCYPEGLSFVDRKVGAERITGHFDIARCKKLYQLVITEKLKPVQFAQSSKAQKFIGVGAGNPYGTLSGLLHTWKLKPNALYALGDIAAKYCTKGWDDLSKRFGVDAFNQTQCADSIFVHEFIFGGSGLALRPQQIITMHKIHNKEPSWTRGYVIFSHQSSRPL